MSFGRPKPRFICLRAIIALSVILPSNVSSASPTRVERVNISLHSHDAPETFPDGIREPLRSGIDKLALSGKTSVVIFQPVIEPDIHNAPSAPGERQGDIVSAGIKGFPSMAVIYGGEVKHLFVFRADGVKQTALPVAESRQPSDATTAEHAARPSVVEQNSRIQQCLGYLQQIVDGAVLKPNDDAELYKFLFDHAAAAAPLAELQAPSGAGPPPSVPNRGPSAGGDRPKAELGHPEPPPPAELIHPSEMGQRTSKAPRRRKNSMFVNGLWAVLINLGIAGLLIFVGYMVNPDIHRTIHAFMVHEKQEKPKEPEKPKPELPKPVEQAKLPQQPRIEVPREAPPQQQPVAAAPPVAAPPAVDIPSVSFPDGGKPVETTTDPVKLYRSKMERNFYLNWERPRDMDPHTPVAEFELSIDPEGNVKGISLTKSSGFKEWDEAARKAIEVSGNLGPPPPHFPLRVPIRFDVVEQPVAGS